MTKYKIFLNVEEKETLRTEIIREFVDSNNDHTHKKNSIHYEVELYLEIDVMDESLISKKFGSIFEFTEDIGGAAIGLFLRKNCMTTVELCNDRKAIERKLLEILRTEFNKYQVEIQNFLIYAITILDRSIVDRLERLEMQKNI